MIAPAIFLGIQPGFNNVPAIELYNLLARVGHHPPGSTVSRKTLEDHGYVPPAVTPTHLTRPKIRSLQTSRA